MANNVEKCIHILQSAKSDNEQFAGLLLVSVSAVIIHNREAMSVISHIIAQVEEQPGTYT